MFHRCLTPHTQQLDPCVTPNPALAHAAPSASRCPDPHSLSAWKIPLTLQCPPQGPSSGSSVPHSHQPPGHWELLCTPASPQAAQVPWSTPVPPGLQAGTLLRAGPGTKHSARHAGECSTHCPMAWRSSEKGRRARMLGQSGKASGGGSARGGSQKAGRACFGRGEGMVPPGRGISEQRPREGKQLAEGEREAYWC